MLSESVTVRVSETNEQKDILGMLKLIRSADLESGLILNGTRYLTLYILHVQ